MSQIELNSATDPEARFGVDKRTPLMVAALGGKIDVIKALMPVSSPAAVDVDGANALMYAAMGGSVAAIKELSGFCNPLERDAMGRTALMLAAKLGKVQAVEELLSHGGVLTKDNRGATAMDWAMEKSSSDGFKVVRSIRAFVAAHPEIEGIETLREPALKSKRMGM